MRQGILKAKQIIVDDKLYPRKQTNRKTVIEYIKSMNMGDVFPNIYVAFFKNKYYLVDGKHRLEANMEIGNGKEEFIQCDIKNNFPSFQDMFLASVRANQKHGQRLNKDDKEKIKDIMIVMKFKSDDISKMTGINIDLIERKIMGKIKNKLMNTAISKGKMPTTLKDNQNKIEEIKVVNEKESKELWKKNQDEWHYDQLNDICEFLSDNKFNLKDKDIVNLIKKLKKIVTRLK